MIVDSLFDSLGAAIKRSLDVRLERHNLIQANVVNADTPNYVPVDMDFHDTLSAVADGQVGVSVPKEQVYYDPTATPGPDGNAVDMDREMTRMAMNQLGYSTALRIMSKRAAILRMAIMEGRG